MRKKELAEGDRRPDRGSGVDVAQLREAEAAIAELRRLGIPRKGYHLLSPWERPPARGRRRDGRPPRVALNSRADD